MLKHEVFVIYFFIGRTNIFNNSNKDNKYFCREDLLIDDTEKLIIKKQALIGKYKVIKNK